MARTFRVSPGTVRWAGMVAGPVLGAITFMALPESYSGSGGDVVGLSGAGRATAAVAVWMATWWFTEALPVYATALLPLALFPLVGATSMREAAAPYGHELIFLFLGGFIVALAMERWGLHKRIAFSALRSVGTRPRRIIAVFMGITAFLSMWITNTATTIMMLPIALSVVGLLNEQEREQRNTFGVCLLLGIAYAASIGGVGTLIGTVPNAFLASYLDRELGIELSFADWMSIGVPLVLVFVPVVWVLLTRVLYPVGTTPVAGSEDLIRAAYRALGPMSRGERTTLVVFVLTASCWILRRWLSQLEWDGWRPLAGLSDSGIAVLAALTLFVLPVNVRARQFAMDWETAVKLPWGLLILFGGGLSLAGALDANGVSNYVGSAIGQVATLPGLVVVLIVTALVIFLTELTSNTATTATLIPVLAAVAVSFDLNPLLLTVPATVAASCAFMLPVATPPNAIVFGSGRLSIPQMARAGLWLNLAGVILITTLTYLVAMPLLGVDIGGSG